jgi:hypothetical protein
MQKSVATCPFADVISASTPKEASGDAGLRKRQPIYLDEIQRRAYRKWQAAGRPGGDCTRFWLEAEQELLQTREPLSSRNG